MSRTAPLFDPMSLISDLTIVTLSNAAQLFFYKLCMIANDAGGYVMHNGRALTGRELAQFLRLRDEDMPALWDEISSLVGQDENGIFVHDMKARQELRDKRRAAGKKGGNPRLIKLKNHVQKDLLKQKENQPETGSHQRVSGKAQKEKRTKKEKYNNNNIFYLYNPQSAEPHNGYHADRLNAEIPEFEKQWCYAGKVIKLRRGEYAELQRQCPWISSLDDVLDRQDDWLDEQDGKTQQAWRFVTAAFLRKVNAQAKSEQSADDGYAEAA